MAPFGIKKRSKVLIRRLKVGNMPNTVHKYPYTATIGTVNVFKKQHSNSKAVDKSQEFFKAPQLLQTDLQTSQLFTSLASQDMP